MRLFSHTIADYTCSQHCGYHRSIAAANLSYFHLFAAAGAAIPLWIISLGDPWRLPWYYLFCILAGELVLLILVGLAAGLLLMPFTMRGTQVCKNCGAAMFLAGRHFDPLGSSKPHWSDIVMFAIFVAMNVMISYGFMWGNIESLTASLP
ncbi:MAG: hypothetical protein ABFD91_02590 [Anaerohalosphaeraceae bacterium]